MKKNKTCRTAKNRFKTFGEGKDLEYTITVTELPKIDLKSFKNIKYDEYTVKIDPKETDKRIDQIAKTQNNFKDAVEDYKVSKDGDSYSF